MYKSAGRFFNGGGSSKIGEDAKQEMLDGRVSLPSGMELSQAGVAPCTSLEFIEEITDALKELTSEGRWGCAQLAESLNLADITNNLGTRWTARLVKLFDQRYSRLNVRF